MIKLIFTFDNIEIKKDEFYRHKSPIFLKKGVDIENVLASNKIFSLKKTINTLLVICMMIANLNYYI